jgi:hypothetical protein
MEALVGLNGLDSAPRAPETQRLLCGMQEALRAEQNELRQRQIIRDTAEQLEPLWDDETVDDLHAIAVDLFGFSEDFVCHCERI